MEDLVQFLRARFAHEEAHAKKDLWAAEKATSGKWRARYGVNLDHSWVETENTPVLRLDAAQHEADALLAARFQPETVKQRANAKLAELEAKQALLSDLLADQHYTCEDMWYSCAAVTEGDYACADDSRAGGPCDCDRDTRVLRRLRLLALPYSDHEDYREEWKP